MAAYSGWLAAMAIVLAALVPIAQRARTGRRAAPSSPSIRLHVLFGFVTSSLAFGHTLLVLPALGSPAATGGGFLALLPGGVAFFLLVAHAGLGLQLRRNTLRDRARTRRAHAATALSIAIAVAAHAAMLSLARSGGGERQSAPPAAPISSASPTPSSRPERPRFQPGPSNPVRNAPVPSRQPAAPVAERTLEARAANELQREDYEAARNSAQECLRVDPANRECFRTELFSYSRSGDFASAKLLLEECLFDEPNDVDCLSGMVTQHVRAGDFVSARGLAERLRSLAPGSISSLLAGAQIADRTASIDEAISLYEGACSLGQEFACVRAEELRERRPR